MLARIVRASLCSFVIYRTYGQFRITLLIRSSDFGSSPLKINLLYFDM
jgi:hypothetical protein